MANNLKQGQMVFLNSGSPKMTVEFVDGDFVDCTWFDKNEVPQEKRYHHASLKLAASQITLSTNQVGS